jgi:PEP-CTERM motif
MRKSATALLALIAAFAGATTAQADPFPVNVLLANFNAITMGNFATTSDVNGPVLIGGNLSSGGLSGILDFLNIPQTCCTTPTPNYAEINVFGNNSGTFSESTQRAFVGGSNMGSFGSGPVTTGYTFPGFNQPGAGSNAATFSQDIWTPLVTVSNNLAGLGPNSSLVGNTFTPGNAAGTPAVFDLTLAQLNALTGGVTFGGCIGAGTCDTVINVIGTGTFTQGFSFPVGDNIPGLPNLIFNFVGATGVEWGAPSNFDASILAVDAVGSNNGSNPLVGNLVVSSVLATAPLGNEVHEAPFDCSDDLCTTTPVPEPGSLALLGGALAFFAALACSTAMRRRQS